MPQAYNKSFAHAYNLMWTDFGDRMGPRALEFYRGTEAGAAMLPVLDLCCGTATVSLYYLAAGYEVVGIDLSEPMLAIARDHAREFIEAGQARFVEADVSNFDVGDGFGMAVSIFDSMNHLDDLAALEGCFARTFKALAPGGYFVFDVNTRLGLRHWAEITVDDSEDALVIKRGGFDPRSNKAFYKVSGVTRADDGRYDRFEEMVIETAFDLDEVKGLLEKTGFTSVYCASALELEKPINEPEDEDRVFFVARK